MKRTKLHVYIPTKLFTKIHSSVDKLAVVLSDSARGKFSRAIVNASFFEKKRRWRYRYIFEKLAALPLLLVIWKFSGATAIASAISSER